MPGGNREWEFMNEYLAHPDAGYDEIEVSEINVFLLDL